ncbi:MAG: glycosyltransferase [Treponema sp.]|uniref:glycosyltransferase family 2 protein n=1 Tax=Treponema sp. TaxID=166 RepID=UPI00298E6FF4|nr:glycosyltransferase family 2 protein [Treponema sp.]MCQ2599971.1 glycosyltransferase [Treponema sp.]
MKKVFLSVVIPFYNSNRTARESIASVFDEIENLYQDKNLAKIYSLEDTVSEIICCNDGSDDGTAEYLDGVSSADFGSGNCSFIEIKVMHLKNCGVASARNAGLDVCRGSFIAFNDSDDMWLKGSLVKRLSILTEEPNADLITANHEYDSQFIPKYAKAKSHVNLFYISLKDGLYKNCFIAQNSILKRRMIDDGVRFKDGMRYSEELYFIGKAAYKYKCLFLNEKMSKSIMKKERFGESGLSKNIRALKKGEARSLKLLYKELGISYGLYFGARVHSLFRYLKRAFIVAKRKAV